MNWIRTNISFATFPLVDHDGKIPLPRISAPLPPFGEIFAVSNATFPRPNERSLSPSLFGHSLLLLVSIALSLSLGPGAHEVWFGFKTKTNTHKSQPSKSKPAFKPKPMEQLHFLSSPGEHEKKGDFLGAKEEKRGGHSHK